MTALRDEADIVITNPPFSLFRPFMNWLFDADCQFSVIGNMNAITYNEIFPHIKANRCGKGRASQRWCPRVPRVPSHYARWTQQARLSVDEHGNKYIRVKGIRWFTNIDHGRRHEPLQLMTMADNIKFNKTHQGSSAASSYQKYDNYDAIEVPFVPMPSRATTTV